MERSLREALRYRGCLICYVLDKDESDFMAQLQYDTVREEKVRRDLVLTNGYCNFHFYQMSRLSSPIVNAVLAKDLIEEEIKGKKRGSFGAVWRIDCPACRHVEDRENFYLQEFKTFLQERSFQKEYESSDGLCRIHLKRNLDLLGESELSHFLIATQVLHLKLLKLELETFISKVRSTSRDMGPEKDSWWVAIEKWVGKKGLKVK